MVEYRLQHPKKHQKFSIKKWLYLRYVYHHFIEEIGRGMFIIIRIYLGSFFIPSQGLFFLCIAHRKIQLKTSSTLFHPPTPTTNDPPIVNRTFNLVEDRFSLRSDIFPHFWLHILTSCKTDLNFSEQHNKPTMRAQKNSFFSREKKTPLIEVRNTSYPFTRPML